MKRVLLFLFLILGVTGLFLEQQVILPLEYKWVTSFIDFLLVIFLIVEFLLSVKDAPVKKHYIKNHKGAFAFILIYVSLFIFNRVSLYINPNSFFRGYIFLVVVRNLLLLLKVFGRMRKFTEFLNSIFSKPAQTVVLSFVLVILVGTLLLMMPIMTLNRHISFINALFTVTSAVCVTGLAVVDTALYFSIYGKIVIMILIQIGGLGIMLLSYFMVFAFRQSVSLKDRDVLSFMLNKSDLKGISNSVKKIIFLTFAIEFIGAITMFPYFLISEKSTVKAVFFSVFHAVSAFCNAGFSLFSDSLESFSGVWGINIIIAGLIIAGGISFSVLTELSSGVRLLFKRKKVNLSINTKVVLNVTIFLIVAGMLVVYKLEHKNQLYKLPLYKQYLAAFFQSVTLRTAGFNTISFSIMTPATLLFMICIMFIGGASGSTAGGIKVNTLGVVWAYIQSFRKGTSDTLIYKHIVSRESILQAFTIIIFGMLSIISASLIMMITEDSSPMAILFETVSAFATVGLSTGITSSLSIIGKICIIILMFFGRLGPLTLLNASSRKHKNSRISYPEAQILVG